MSAEKLFLRPILRAFKERFAVKIVIVNLFTKIMKKYISLVCLFCMFGAHAYVPSPIIQAQATGLSKKINTYIERLT